MDLNSKFSSLKDIKFSLSNQVATVTLNRPTKGNALSNQMGHELQQVMSAIDNEYPRVRAVVITGEGKFFCTGMDLTAFNASGQAPISPMQIFACLRNSKVPIIAKVNGPVMAGGTGLIPSLCTLSVL
jgi:methylglutaconyl-CoA hydratase